MTNIFIVTAVMLSDGTNFKPGVLTARLDANLPLTPMEGEAIKEMAIESILQYPENREQGWGREGLQVAAFFMLAADKDGKIKMIQAGETL